MSIFDSCVRVEGKDGSHNMATLTNTLGTGRCRDDVGFFFLFLTVESPVMVWGVPSLRNGSFFLMLGLTF